MPDDAARFYGTVKATEDGGFRGACWISTSPDSPPEEGSLDRSTFRSREEARAWVHGQAGARGFERYEMTEHEPAGT